MRDVHENPAGSRHMPNLSHAVLPARKAWALEIKSPNGGGGWGKRFRQKAGKTSLARQSFVYNIHRMFPFLCPWY